MRTNEERRVELLSSFLTFTKVFYKLLNNRPFVMSQPLSRESHYITIAKELTLVFKLQTNSLLINLPPGYGKSTFMICFIAWSMAHYPDSQFLYISYSKNLARKHTATIKRLMSLPEYTEIFGIHIPRETSASDNFKTNKGGCVAAFGSDGSITGNDGGLPNLSRFSGGVFIDDIHKPNEVHSDTIREGVKTNYQETIKTRVRADNVPIVCIAQRLHEDDLPGNLIEGFDGRTWKTVILKSIDDAGNALAPNLTSLEKLKIEEHVSPYVFASQYQQNPMPAGGGLFARNEFVLLEEDPKILSSFVTIDSAETEKTWNDATAMSMWGIYKIEQAGFASEIYGLHWLDCLEIRIEPKDLQAAVLAFWMDCMRHPVQPSHVAIEKKSTGVTLCSILKQIRGLQIIEVERTIASGSKIDRFIACQRYVRSGLISLPKEGKHTELALNHMAKITTNNSHRFDDICDTFEMGVQLGLVSKTVQNLTNRVSKTDDIVSKLNYNLQAQINARRVLHDYRR